ncbi:hypothetical protein EJP77_18630 [Paenibacillus zeisoli]|uniref:Uncharacterized protein n=1 Tax=Paenibacillus zeisoli TaxID=2496267 RepID=A0A433X1N1_9BACL|nr:hypothetical protein [Paenibacillus zeisoli]RUT28033.1 hypothetical protein EJP77_18630 [Paenibacillus zeisoli]
MNKSINKYLYYLGTGVILFFALYIIATNLLEKTYYTLYVNEKMTGEFRKVEGLEDSKGQINMYNYNVPGFGLQNKKINVLVTKTAPLYILFNQKTQEIEYVTDNVKKLNEYLRN